VITILKLILGAFATIGQTVWWAIASFFNMVSDAIGVAATALFELFPTMPSIGTFAPSWLGWANWFFPFGGVVAIFTSALVLYVAWLVVRYLANLLRAM
jgi:hypothetical protein